jgi:hypothetical protein
MALDQGTVTVAVTSQERTWRVNIETPQGADPTITIQRENRRKRCRHFQDAKRRGVARPYR